MGIRRFFSNNPVVKKCIPITGEEFHHLKNVIRIKAGDKVEVVSGEGSLFLGEIVKMDDSEAVVNIMKEKKENRPMVKIIIAPSLLKKRNMSLMIEKLTEMGVDEIRPVFYSRTDEKYNSSMLKKWNRIAMQSLKVNKMLWVSRIYPPVNIDEIIQFSKDINTKVLLDIAGEKEINSDFKPPVLSVVGPPGDFLKEEKALFIKNGFVPYKINNCTLKSETAAISMGAILSRISNKMDS